MRTMKPTTSVRFYPDDGMHAVIVPLLMDRRLKSAVKYVSPTETLKATIRRPIDLRSRHVEIVVSIGKPNYQERLFIKACRKAKEPFPVKKVQLKYHKGVK